MELTHLAPKMSRRIEALKFMGVWKQKLQEESAVSDTLLQACGGKELVCFEPALTPSLFLDAKIAQVSWVKNELSF